MSILAKCCILLVLAALAVPAASQKFLSASPDLVSRDRVAEQLRSLLGHGQKTERLASIEDFLRPTVMALPRDSRGSLEHRVSRYALYRYFLVRHGWHVKGLSLEAEETNSSTPAVMLKSGMPSFIFELLLNQIGSDRLGLEELAVLAATVEDLAHSDAVDLLELVYKTHAVSTDELLDKEMAGLLIRTFTMFSLFPSAQEDADNQRRTNLRLESVGMSYPGWDAVLIWVQDLGQGLEYQDRSALRPFAATAGHHVDFTSMVRWATLISSGFGQFSNIECREMKNSMLDMEDEEREDGRVGLAQYYTAFLETGLIYFSESPAYLRHIGALDERNPLKPSVIVPNAMSSKSNCMSASGFVAFCCIDACEVLMAGLEQELSEPVAAPALIAAAVSAMPSETVAAPRNLSAPMRSRLDEIAGRHGGSVPLHSRLFAQWMHYAFPNECPYPRSLLTSETQLPAGAWTAKTKRSETVSRKEMLHFKNLANRSLREQWVSDGPVLLWSEDEELLSNLLSAPKHGAMFSALRWVAGLAALVASAAAMLEAVCGESSVQGGKLTKQSWLRGGVSTSGENRMHSV